MSVNSIDHKLYSYFWLNVPFWVNRLKVGKVVSQNGRKETLVDLWALAYQCKRSLMLRLWAHFWQWCLRPLRNFFVDLASEIHDDFEAWHDIVETNFRRFFFRWFLPNFLFGCGNTGPYRWWRLCQRSLNILWTLDIFLVAFPTRRFLPPWKMKKKILKNEIENNFYFVSQSDFVPSKM